MARVAATTLKNVKAITRGEADIQRLNDSDELVTLVLAQVAKQVEESIYGDLQEPAQRYLAAHFLSQALNDPGGRGPLSAESVGGVSQSWTLPYLNRKDVLGATQYGMQFLSYRDMVVVPARAIPPCA